jgi:hypothetical protein
MPPGVEVVPGNGRLTVTFTAAADGSEPTAFAASAVDPAGAVATCSAGAVRGTGSCTIEGLANGTTYQVTGITGTALGNSPVSGPVAAAPVPVPTPGRIRAAVVTGNSKVTLRIVGANGNGSAITSASVTCRKGSIERTAVVNQSKAVIAKMPSGTYQCTVSAANQYGSASSTPQKVKVPRA